VARAAGVTGPAASGSTRKRHCSSVNIARTAGPGEPAHVGKVFGVVEHACEKKKVSFCIKKYSG